MIKSRLRINGPLLSISCFSLFLLCLILVGSQSPSVIKINAAVLSFFTSFYDTSLKSAAIAISTFGHKSVFVKVVIAYTLILALLRRWDAVAYVSTLTWPIFWTCQFLKENFTSLRPDWALIAHMGLKASYSFPSRHVAAFTVIGLAMITLANKKLKMPLTIVFALSLAALAWARLYLTAHWLTDIAGALFLAAAWSHLVIKYCKPSEPIPTAVYPIVICLWGVFAGQYLSNHFSGEMYAYTPFIQVAQHSDAQCFN